MGCMALIKVVVMKGLWFGRSASLYILDFFGGGWGSKLGGGYWGIGMEFIV